MRPDEFDAFRAAFIDAWAADLATIEELPVERARVEAARRTDADLTGGLATPGHRVYVITADDRTVGTLWFSFGDGKAFLDDVTVAEHERGRGYGRRALQLMEQELRALGVTAVALNVYTHNPRAQALYAELGYAATGTSMRKRLDG